MMMALGAAGTATAQSGTAATVLTPSTVSSGSALSIAITGISGFSGLPSSVALTLQPGFTSSIKSVSALCTSTQSGSNGCPAASQIGTGAVGVSFFGSPTTVLLKLYLGDPIQPGDIASVILSGSLDGINLTVSGRLFVPPGGGLELLLSSFPSEPVTLDALSVSMYASRTVTKTIITRVTKTVFTGKGKHRHKHKVHKKVKKKIKTVYSAITNPSTCTSTGAWTGTAIFTYSSGTDQLPLTAICTAS